MMKINLRRFIIGSILFIYVVLLLNIWLVVNREIIVVKKNLSFEVNSNIKLASIIKNTKNVAIVGLDDEIDTSSIGEKDININYINKNDKKKSLVVTINVIDTKKPKIESENKVTLYVGDKLNVDDIVKVTDNSNEKIVPEVVGDYDLKKDGSYELKFVATDSSGNISEKKFTLVVEKAGLKTTGYYVYKTKDAWFAFRFKKNGKVEYIVNACPGSGCGGYGLDGTYKIEGNKIKATMTHESSEEAINVKLKKPIKWDFDYLNENRIKLQGDVFVHKKSFN